MTALFRRTLLDALRAGGRQLKGGFGKARVRYKSLGRANALTQVDLAAEKAILRVIRSRFPEHDFLAEERATRRSGAEYLWVIDPLDGTLNFAHGFPVCCVSIALLRGLAPLIGGVYDPFREEFFLAEAGRGATLNGRRIRVSRVRKIEDGLLATGFPYDRDVRATLYSEWVRRFLCRAQDLRRGGSAALDLAWVAAGRLDGYWELRLNPWDVAAGLLLVREAGGNVTDLSGKPWTALESFGKETVASNGRIQQAMLDLLK